MGCSKHGWAWTAAALVLWAAGCVLSHEREPLPVPEDVVVPEPALAPECAGPYVVLDAPARSVEFETDYRRCDRLTTAVSITGHTAEPVPEGYVGPGWYRFSGEAGTSIPLAPPEQNRCGGDATGWMTEPPPTVEEGVVDREVCFRFFDNDCLWPTTIRVVHCDGFLLFELVDTPQCHLRYCGADLDVSRYR